MSDSITFHSNLILVIMPLLFISVSILCGFAMLSDLYILLSPQEEVFLREQMYASGSTFIKKMKGFVCHHISMPQ